MVWFGFCLILNVYWLTSLFLQKDTYFRDTSQIGLLQRYSAFLSKHLTSLLTALKFQKLSNNCLNEIQIEISLINFCTPLRGRCDLSKIDCFQRNLSNALPLWLTYHVTVFTTNYYVGGKELLHLLYTQYQELTGINSLHKSKEHYNLQTRIFSIF